MKKCKDCVIGTYSHSASEDAPLTEELVIDGLGNMFPPRVFNYCPNCGTKINKKKHFKYFKKLKAWVWKDYRVPKFHLRSDWS